MSGLCRAARAISRVVPNVMGLIAFIPSFLMGLVLCAATVLCIYCFYVDDVPKDETGIWLKQEVFTEQNRAEALNTTSNVIFKFLGFFTDDSIYHNRNPYNEIFMDFKPVELEPKNPEQQTIYDKDLALGYDLNRYLLTRDLKEQLNNEDLTNQEVQKALENNEATNNLDTTGDTYYILAKYADQKPSPKIVQTPSTASKLHKSMPKKQLTQDDIIFYQGALRSFSQFLGIEQQVFGEKALSQPSTQPLDKSTQPLSHNTSVPLPLTFKQAAFISSSLFEAIFGSSDSEHAPSQESSDSTTEQNLASDSAPEQAQTTASATPQDEPSNNIESIPNQEDTSELRNQALQHYRLEHIDQQTFDRYSVTPQMESKSDILEEELVTRTKDLLENLQEQEALLQKNQQNEVNTEDTQDSSLDAPAHTYAQDKAKAFARMNPSNLTKEQAKLLLQPNSAGWDSLVANDYPILYSSSEDAKFITSLYKDPNSYGQNIEHFWALKWMRNSDFTQQFIAPTCNVAFESQDGVLTFYQAQEQLKLIKKHLCSKGICEEDYVKNPDLYQKLLSQAYLLWHKGFLKEKKIYDEFKDLLKVSPKFYLAYMSLQDMRKITAQAIELGFKDLPQSNPDSKSEQTDLEGQSLSYLAYYLMLNPEGKMINAHKNEDEIIAYPRFIDSNSLQSHYKRVFVDTRKYDATQTDLDNPFQEVQADTNMALLDLYEQETAKDKTDQQGIANTSDQPLSIKEQIQHGQNTLQKLNELKKAHNLNAPVFRQDLNQLVYIPNSNTEEQAPSSKQASATSQPVANNDNSNKKNSSNKSNNTRQAVSSPRIENRSDRIIWPFTESTYIPTNLGIRAGGQAGSTQNKPQESKSQPELKPDWESR